MSGENLPQDSLIEEQMLSSQQAADNGRRCLLAHVFSVGLAGVGFAAIASSATIGSVLHQQNQMALSSRVLYFDVFSYRSPTLESFNELVSIAHSVMQSAGLTSIADHGWWVDGQTTAGHSIIAFVGGTAQDTNAVVISFGDDGQAVITQLAILLQDVTVLS